MKDFTKCMLLISCLVVQVGTANAQNYVKSINRAVHQELRIFDTLFVLTEKGGIINNGLFDFALVGHLTNHGAYSNTGDETTGPTYPALCDTFPEHAGINEFGDRIPHTLIDGTQPFRMGMVHVNRNITLRTQLQITDTLFWESGVIATSRLKPSDCVHFMKGSMLSSKDSTLFIDGYAAWSGEGPFVLPIGDSVYTGFLGVEGICGKMFRAAYVHGNPSLASASYGGPFAGTALGEGLSTVSETAYWVVSGSDSTQLTFHFDNQLYIDSIVSSLRDLRVAGWDGSRWVNLGNTDTSGMLSSSGMIISEKVVPDSFLAFTLAAGCQVVDLGAAKIQDTVTICRDSELTGLQWLTAGATDLAQSATANSYGLPPGVSASWENDTLKISGAPSEGGVYAFSIGLSGCEDQILDGTIRVLARPAVSVSGSGPYCLGDSLFLSETGGSATGWSWSGPSGYASEEQNPGGFATMSGPFVVEVRDENGCKARDTTEVVVNSLPDVDGYIDGLHCEGEQFVLKEKGGEAISWFWSGPGNFQSTVQNTFVVSAEVGFYRVAGIDANGCQSSDSVQVFPLPMVSAINSGPYCAGQIGYVYELGGDAVSWVWQYPSGFTSGKRNPQLSPVIPGDFIVTGTDSRGCHSSDTTTICVSEPKVVCKQDITLVLDSSGTAGLTSDMVNDGTTGSACAGLKSLTLSKNSFICVDAGVREVDLIATDSLGCQASCTAEVIVIDPLSLPGESCACDGDDLVLDGILVSDDYKASIQIESAGTVQSGDTVILQASQAISLRPGFVAEAGSALIARIDSCVASWERGHAFMSRETFNPKISVDSVLNVSPFISDRTAGMASRVYPNPFYGTFLLEIDLDFPTHLRVDVQSMDGLLIQRVLPETAFERGTHRFEIDGSQFAAGMYFIRISSQEGQIVHKVVRVLR